MSQMGSNPKKTPPAKEADIADHHVIAGLLGPLRAEAERTRLAIEDRTRQQRRIATLLIAFMLVMLFLFLLELGILIQNRQRSAQARQTLDTSAKVAAQIADCTTPGGTCYNAGQARTGAAIQRLDDDHRRVFAQHQHRRAA
jgi:hypothetical protein